MVCRAFLFDFDGVIADSEPLHLETFREIVKPLNIKISEERWYKEFVGIGSPQIMKTLLEEIGITDEAAIKRYVVERRQLFESRILEGRLVEKPGLSRFLEEAKKLSIKTAVVSGGHKVNVMLALKTMKLDHYFDAVIGREDYENKKPHPESYQTGMKKLGVRPDECIAFEDSVSGCLSAEAAGIRVIALESRYEHYLEEEGCKPVMKIRDFRGLKIEGILR
jgi:HAD superfamily hydrolase (TIGR01509 family)